MPSVVSLFSGCSGSDLGFDQAGFDIVFANEINGAACDTYEANFGVRPIETPLGEYLRSTQATCVGFCGLDHVDVVIGGPPCPSFSSQRFYKRRTAEGLTHVEEMHEVVRRVRPKIVVCENVPTLLEPQLEAAYAFFISGFVSLGYRMQSFLLNAVDYGLPQDRERLFMIGQLSNSSANSTIGAISNSKPFTKPKGQHYGVHCSGWANYLGISDRFILLGKSSSTRGREGNRASFKVVGSGNMCIREVGAYIESKRTDSLRTGERLLIGQRALSNNELAKLQGFPQDFIFCGLDQEITQQIGNAWAVPVAKAIAEECRRIL